MPQQCSPRSSRRGRRTWPRSPYCTPRHGTHQRKYTACRSGCSSNKDHSGCRTPHIGVELLLGRAVNRKILQSGRLHRRIEKPILKGVPDSHAVCSSRGAVHDIRYRATIKANLVVVGRFPILTLGTDTEIRDIFFQTFSGYGILNTVDDRFPRFQNGQFQVSGNRHLVQILHGHALDCVELPDAEE